MKTIEGHFKAENFCHYSSYVVPRKYLGGSIAVLKKMHGVKTMGFIENGLDKCVFPKNSGRRTLLYNLLTPKVFSLAVTFFVSSNSAVKNYYNPFFNCSIFDVVNVIPQEMMDEYFIPSWIKAGFEENKQIAKDIEIVKNNYDKLRGLAAIRQIIQ